MKSRSILSQVVDGATQDELLRAQACVITSWDDTTKKLSMVVEQIPPDWQIQTGGGALII